MTCWEFPGIPVVRIHASTNRDPGLIPGQGTKILPAVQGDEKKKKRLVEEEQLKCFIFPSLKSTYQGTGEPEKWAMFGKGG